MKWQEIYVRKRKETVTDIDIRTELKEEGNEGRSGECVGSDKEEVRTEEEGSGKVA